MHGFEDRAVIANIRAGHESQPADERRAQVRNNVAVEVFHHQHVVLIRIHHQLHAGVVHNVLAVGNLGIVFGHIAGSSAETSPSDSFMMLALWMA